MTAARQERTAEGLDPRLLLRLVKSWRYLLGLALDGFAFLLSIVALQTMPLFAVQAIVSSFLAITAVGLLALIRRAVPSPAVLVTGAFAVSHGLAMVMAAPWTYGYKSILPTLVLSLFWAMFLLRSRSAPVVAVPAAGAGGS